MIDARGSSLDAPTGGSWRTFGSPIGAGQPVNGHLLDSPPWPANPTDDAGFRELDESPDVSLFVADDNLLETWLDTQDGSPEYWTLPARQLSLRVAGGTAIALAMVGRTLAVRGNVFGVVTAATFVPRVSTNIANHRNSYDRFDLTLDRDAPRLTIYDFVAVPDVDYTNQDEGGYVWAYLDPTSFFSVVRFTGWCEIIDTVSVDTLAVDVDESQQVADQRIETTVRVRYDPRITPFSSATIDGESYGISSVEEEVGAGRRRFMTLSLRRFALPDG